MAGDEPAGVWCSRDGVVMGWNVENDCRVEESAKDGLGQGERMGMGKKKMPGFDGRWTVTAT